MLRIGGIQTYAILDCIYDYRDIISMFCNKHFPEVQLNTFDWEISNMIKKNLKNFFELNFLKYFEKIKPFLFSQWFLTKF